MELMMGYAANRAADKKPGWLVSWLMSDAGEVFLGMSTGIVLAFAFVI